MSSNKNQQQKLRIFLYYYIQVNKTKQKIINIKQNKTNNSIKYKK